MEGSQAISSHYTKAVEHLEKGDTLHAEVEALLYIGEQIEQGVAFGAQNLDQLTKLVGRSG